MEKRKKENRFSGMTREETLRQARKQILRSAVMALAALIVIGIACYAWFVSSGTVTAITGPVSMREQGFELASAGDGIDDNIAAYNKYKDYLDSTLPEGEFWDNDQTTTWTRKNQTIRWRVDENSNFGNDGRKKVWPGAEGTLSFYVIPNETGELNIRCNLDLQAKLKEKTADGNNLPDRAADTVAKLMRGHILFLYSVYDADETTVIADGIASLTDGSFEVCFHDAQAGTPRKVTLHWVWPYLLREAVDYHDDIKKWTEDPILWDYFYYNNGKPINITGMLSKDLNRYYNNADQFIGDYVDGIVLDLTADLAQ